MVGSAIARCLTKRGDEVLKVDRETVDLRNQAAVEAWLRQNRPDAIVLAAARVGGIYANDTFPVRIIVQTDDRPGMLNQLTSVLSDENTNIRSLEAKTEIDRDGAIVEMTVDVRDKKQLEKLVAAMRRISGVRDVERQLN